MMAVQPPATTAGPTPNGMISAPLPDNAQPLPERFERLSTIVKIHRRTPAITPRIAISPANPGSFFGSPTDPAIDQHASRCHALRPLDSPGCGVIIAVAVNVSLRKEEGHPMAPQLRVIFVHGISAE